MPRQADVGMACPCDTAGTVPLRAGSCGVAPTCSALRPGGASRTVTVGTGPPADTMDVMVLQHRSPNQELEMRVHSFERMFECRA